MSNYKNVRKYAKKTFILLKQTFFLFKIDGGIIPKYIFTKEHPLFYP